MADQLTFPELEFAKDRTALTVAECARKLGYTEEHIIGLIECGQIEAINGATKFETVRVPRHWLAELGRRAGIADEARLFEDLQAARAAQGPIRRPSYRIPPSAWKRFLAGHSTA